MTCHRQTGMPYANSISEWERVTRWRSCWEFSPTPRLAREVAALCAERDLKLVGLLNEHGEAQDVSADDLRNAFIALVNARKVCFSGHIKEALAIYDGVGFSGGKTAKYFRPSK
jgi:hypothetical protein